MTHSIVKTVTNRMAALPPPERGLGEAPGRRRLWEIDARYLCPLMGLCLSRAELRRLARERVYGLDATAGDYPLHAAFVGLARVQDQRSKALNRYLEKKYRPALRRYAAAADDEALRELWRQDCAEGREGQAWWHLITHPRSGSQLLEALYGELHMLGHEAIALIRSERGKSAALQERVAVLEEVLSSEREQQTQERQRLESTLEALRRQLDAQSELEWENQELAQENERLRREQEALRGGSLLQEHREQLDALRDRNRRLQEERAAMEEELGLLQLLHQEAEEREGRQAAELRTLQEQYAELMEELAAVEQRLHRHAGGEQGCPNCGECGEGTCPATGLCGKTVLYVGGLHKMVPHYRRVVEDAGGRFLHHDGGVEAARGLLPKMLSTADAVMCPIDCVSHDACVCVKRMCKRLNKPCVLMRSSGLSSLARGLDEIVQ